MSSNLDNLTRLAMRFLEDRESLDDLEMHSLVEGLRAHPQAARTLRGQLEIDELLAQRLSLDRRDFALQVDQRIADARQGEELDRQAAEIREIALRQIHETPRRRGHWSEVAPYAAIAVVTLLAVGAGTFWWSGVKFEPTPLCQVDDVREQPEVVRAAGDIVPATPGTTLFAGDRLSTRGGAYARVRFADGTTATLEPESTLGLANPTASFGKRLDLYDGVVSASVTPQPVDRPLAVSTRDAHAVVRGTEFTLRASRAGTELDVAEGKVELVERRGGAKRMVGAREAARATSGKAPVASVPRWPVVRAGLILAMTDGRHVQHWPEFGALPEWLEFEAGGEGADWTAADKMVLDGGWFRQRAAGAVFARQVLQSDAFTIEAILVPNSRTDEGVFLSLGDAGKTHLAIRQTSAGLALSFDVVERNTDEGEERVQTTRFAMSGPLVPGAEAHLVVACDKHRIRIWLDGRRTLDEVLAGVSDLSAARRRAAWSEAPLTLGADPAGNSPWHGRIERLALYARALEDADVEANVLSIGGGAE